MHHRLPTLSSPPLWTLLFLGHLLACGSSAGDSPGEGSDDPTPEKSTSSVVSCTETNSAPTDENDTETVFLPDLDTAFETDPDALELSGPCPIENHIGGFEIMMSSEGGYTTVDGTVRNDVVSTFLPEQLLIDGHCRLLKKRNLVCNPACSSGETCGLDETCEPMPTGQDMGTVVIQGLAHTVVMAPAQPGNTYFFSELPHPGFDTKDVIRLTTTGGFTAPMELFGIGVEPLVALDRTWILDAGHPLEITWLSPPEGAQSRIQIRITVDQHGLTPITLTCDLPDTGSAAVSAKLVDALLEAGVTGVPSGTMTRRTVDRIYCDEGCVDFRVASVLDADIEVTGHTPCAQDVDCDVPLVCDQEQGTCH